MLQYEDFQDKERMDFAKKAARYFNENDEAETYTEGDIKKDVWFARRWGMGGHRLLVFKISEYEEVINYPIQIGELPDDS